jgi:hypothetical protein
MKSVDELVEPNHKACRRCGTLLNGDDPEPLRHQVIVIPPIPPVVIELRLHRLVYPCCYTNTCAPLPADVEHQALLAAVQCPGGAAGQCLPPEFQQNPGVAGSAAWGGEKPRCDRHHPRDLSAAALEHPAWEDLEVARRQPVAYVVDEVLRAAVETSAPTGGADGGNPDGKCGWQWSCWEAPLAALW